MRRLLISLIVGTFLLGAFSGFAQSHKDAADKKTDAAATAEVTEVDVSGGSSIFGKAWQGGFVVFSVLFTLVLMSIASWAIGLGKIWYLRGLDLTGKDFVKSFWDSRSLNDLNGKLGDFPYSPFREVFRSGYAELVKGSQMRDQNPQHLALTVRAAMENLSRSLHKAKYAERRKLEKNLSFLAISASASPFIGLFGTVWGIMGAFEGIARSGSASLAAVAPGISEALIATAFGLAAAIPAVIAYNMAGTRLRHIMGQIDGFSADLMNIVERYLVSEKTARATGAAVPAAGDISGG